MKCLNYHEMFGAKRSNYAAVFMYLVIHKNVIAIHVYF
jgi:hypothetical protein